MEGNISPIHTVSGFFPSTYLHHSTNLHHEFWRRYHIKTITCFCLPSEEYDESYEQSNSNLSRNGASGQSKSPIPPHMAMTDCGKNFQYKI
jgi:hypothetical protein